jgi:hypothetical protein
MNRAIETGLIKGIMSHLIPKEITHVQYADDMILMVEDDDKSPILF